MGRAPDFIGLGAQKAGTSWIYSCLYEHPELCLPLKEIHFFSRERNWSKGYDWYEAIFAQCPPEAQTGEFSNSYLTDPAVPERIYQRYPESKLIASLRNPVDRAYSNYVHQIKKGEIPRDQSFEEALQHHPEYIEQGRYAAQLTRYRRFFPHGRILPLVYEDCLQQPLAFIQRIYRFLGVNPDFSPSMLHKKVNVSKVPRAVWLESLLTGTAGFLHKKGLRRIWWFAKKLGIANSIRRLNTSDKAANQASSSWRPLVYEALKEDISALEEILGRELRAWHL